MQFNNVKRGIRLVYISRIAAIAATLFGSGLVLLSWLNHMEIIKLEITNLSVIMTAFSAAVLLSLLITVTAVTGFFGFFRASKDEPEFKKAMICTALSGVLGITEVFVLLPNGTLYTILNAAEGVTEMFVMLYAMSGMIQLSNICGRQDMAEKGDRLTKVLLYTYIVSALNAVVIRIFELSAQAQLVSGVLGAADTVLEVAQSLLMLYYLRGVLKMLTE